MMKILFMLGAAVFLAGQVAAGEALVWMRLDFPPSFVVAGPNANRGYSDVALQIILRELPDYSHETVFVNPPKAIQNFKAGGRFCGSGLNRNVEREAFMEFSEPFIKRIPNELVIRKDDLARFKPFMDANGRIDFARLIKEESLLMGYHIDRSYGPSIDKLIAEMKRSHLVHRPASDLTAGFLKMLEARRIDYLIESPDSLRYFQYRDEFKEFYQSLPIKDAVGLLPVYFACAKNDLGKEVIAKINAIIARKKKEFDSGYAYWLDEESRQRWFIQQF